MSRSAPSVSGFHDHMARAIVWVALLLIGVHVLLLLLPGPFNASWVKHEISGLVVSVLPILWARYRMRNDPVKPIEQADERERMLTGNAAQFVAGFGFAALFLLSVACHALPRLLQLLPNAVGLLAWFAYLMLLLQYLALGLARMLVARE